MSPVNWTNPLTAAAGGIVSGGFGLLGNYLNYKYQSRLAEQQNAYNLQMWNLNNEYNSPLNQMKRYEQAGLNSALMYGSVTPGNSSAPPQQVTPDAPDYTQSMKDLAQAFNIEGLRTAIANRKKAQAEARVATAEADDVEAQNDARKIIGAGKRYNPLTGMLEDYDFDFLNPLDKHAHSRYYEYRTLADNFRYNRLLVPRSTLITTQSNLNRTRNNLFAPQVTMRQYDAKYYPVTYWIGNARTGIGAVSDAASIPLKLFRPPIKF